MAHTKFAKRYAKGLWDYAHETDKTEDIYNEMKSLVSGIKESKDLRNYLASPVLDNKKKKKLATEIFKSFSPITQKFIHLVIDHGREINLPELAKSFIDLHDSHKGLQRVSIVSATELDKNIIDKIIHDTGFIDNNQPIEIETKIDPNIIGGYIIRVGDKQLDTSMKTKLNKLKKEFSKNEFIPKYWVN